MGKDAYDPYYRNLPSSVVPARTPFTRPGQGDAGHVFIYVTHKWRRWSLLLDRARLPGLYDEARRYIPRGIAQLLLLEKCYSTRSAPKNSAKISTAQNTHVEPERPLVVLKEPAPSATPQGEVLSYHLDKAAAIAAAESYTRRYRRRAVVGLLLWDEMWL